ncbi:MAG: MarR family transcriptional regulator [Solirubrobacteraceae bacterium]|nr:MarR family transcriptional regulator [Solirubrobacteraceae bacterium]
MDSSVKHPAAVQEAWSLIGELYWQMRPRMLAAAAAAGLTPPQVFALRALDPEIPISMGELATQLHCDSSNVTGLVDGLQSHGLVERRPAERDRRVRMLVVTERGAHVREQLRQVMEEVPPALASLSAADQRALRDVLRRALG